MNLEMAEGILTNRELKNKVTGVDIYVSDYQEVKHLMRTEYLYNVIVVSNLFYYKRREHRESDVVQFVVSKTFDEFEDLYKKLYKRFPSVNLPQLPKTLLMYSKANEKFNCMNKVLKMVASNPKLSSSPMVISFLRGDPVDKQEEENGEHADPEELNEEQSEVDDVDLFGSKRHQIVEDIICPETVGQVSSEKSIFDEEDGISGEIDGDLFMSSDVNKLSYTKEYELDDELDLLELSDDLDELLNLSKTSERQLSIKVHKPQPFKQRGNQSKGIAELLGDDVEPKEDMFKRTKRKSLKREDKNQSSLEDILGNSKKTSLFDADDNDDLFRASTISAKVAVMKDEDIMNYIKEQENVDDVGSLES